MKDNWVPESTSRSIQKSMEETKHQKTWAFQGGRKLNLVKKVTLSTFPSIALILDHLI